MEIDRFKKFKNIIVMITVTLFIASAIIITIISLNKEVEIVYFGNKIKVNTLSYSVADLLNEKGIFVNENVKISCDINDFLKDNMVITIDSNEKYNKLNIETIEKETLDIVTKIIYEEKEVPFSETKIENNMIARGVSKIKEEGKNGINSEIHIVKNLSSEYKFKVDENVVTLPTDKVIEVGTNINLSVNRNENIVIPSVDSGFKVYNIKLSKEEQQYAYYLSKQYGFEYELFLTMMFKESGFRASAIGGGNSYGLCQIHTSNFTNLRKRLGITNFLDPYDNMKAGAYMLDLYLDSARKISNKNEFVEVYALNSYNMGEGGYFNKCYSKGIFHRGYSTSIRKMRDSLKNNGYF